MSAKLWIAVGGGVAVAAVGAAVLVGGGEAPAPAEAPTPVAAVAAAGPTMTVYKSPTCGCCTNWVEHVRAAGFTVETRNVGNAAELARFKAEHGIRPELAACHTALIGDYVVEGHVPADVIRRLLAERPLVAGLAVPGMPVGSPGMEGANAEAYDVLTFDRQGRTTVYASR